MEDTTKFRIEAPRGGSSAECVSSRSHGWAANGISAADCLALAAPAFLFLLLRGWNLTVWLLANIDEVSLLNQTDIPVLSGGSYSSSFFPLSLLNKLLFFCSFPFFRCATFVAHFIVLLALYRLLAPRCGRGSGAFAALFFSCSWYFTYAGRLYEVSSFTPFWGALHILLLVDWLFSRRRRMLLAAVVCWALGLSNYSAPWLYYSAFLGLFLAWEYRLQRLTRLDALLAGGLFVLCGAPFFYNIFVVSSFSANLRYLQGFSGSKQIVLVNLFQPAVFLKTLSEIFVFPYDGAYRLHYAAAAALILLTPIAVQLRRGRGDSLSRFLLLAVAAQLVFIFLSPFVPNNEGHCSLLLLTFLCLAALPGRSACATACSRAAGILVTLLGLVFFARYVVPSNQHQQMQQAVYQFRDAGPGQVLYSDGAYLKLHFSMFEGLERSSARVVSCGRSEDLRVHGELSSYTYMLLSSECLGLLAEDAKLFQQEWYLEQTIESQLKHGIALFTRR